MMGHVEERHEYDNFASDIGHPEAAVFSFPFLLSTATAARRQFNSQRREEESKTSLSFPMCILMHTYEN